MLVDARRASGLARTIVARILLNCIEGDIICYELLTFNQRVARICVRIRGQRMTYTLQQLSDFEDIRTLKHRYFRCIDTANLTELNALFTENVRVDYRGGGYRVQLQG